jgi:Uma2 family endonuclease
MTIDEYFALGDEAKGFDFVDGRLEDNSMSKIANFVTGKLYLRLGVFVEARGLGNVMVAESAFRCFPYEPEKLRKPDIAFLSNATLRNVKFDDSYTFDVVPDLVVEVISPSDHYYRVAAKRADWLAAGVKLYWEVNPDLGTVEIYAPDDVRQIVRRNGTLHGEPVLPGFGLPLAELLPAASIRET